MKKMLFLLAFLSLTTVVGCTLNETNSDSVDLAINELEAIKENIKDKIDPSSITIDSKYYADNSLVGEVRASYDEQEQIYHEITLANNNESHVYLYEKSPLVLERVFSFRCFYKDSKIVETFKDEIICSDEETFNIAFNEKLEETAVPYISRYYARLNETLDNLIYVLKNAVSNVETFFDIDEGIYRIETFMTSYTYVFDDYNLISYKIEKENAIEEHLIIFESSIDLPKFDANGDLIS